MERLTVNKKPSYVNGTNALAVGRGCDTNLELYCNVRWKKEKTVSLMKKRRCVIA